MSPEVFAVPFTSAYAWSLQVLNFHPLVVVGTSAACSGYLGARPLGRFRPLR